MDSAVGLWLLPTELLELILNHLSYESLARLLQCNKVLHNRAEPFLYRSEAREDAMRLACENGYVPTIDLAVSYGAPVSTVTIPAEPGKHSMFHSNGWFLQLRKDNTKPIKVSTLHLAVIMRQIGAFTRLLELGASTDGIDPPQIKALLKRLALPGNEPFFALMLNSGWGHRIKHEHNIDLPLVPVILAGGSLDLVGHLLDSDADPNREQGRDRIPVAPLSAAIEVNSKPIFDKLISAGADIHGQNPDRLCWKRPLHHIPVFAAAAAMAKHGSTAMMELCLDNGAKLDCWVHIMRKYRGCDYYTMTPLLAYLDSIHSWEDTGLSPLEGLLYLIRNGARLECPCVVPSTPLPQKWGTPNVYTPRALGLLVEKWKLSFLTVPRFFEIISFLIEHTPEHTTQAYRTSPILWTGSDRSLPNAVEIAARQQTIADYLFEIDHGTKYSGGTCYYGNKLWRHEYR